MMLLGCRFFLCVASALRGALLRDHDAGELRPEAVADGLRERPLALKPRQMGAERLDHLVQIE